MNTGEIRVYGSSSNITCTTCSYFQHGKCKRIAPEMIVDSSDWCGEHSGLNRKRNPKAVCENCIYFYEYKKDSHVDGECKRFAPAKRINGIYERNGYEGQNIPTDKDRWCGEHPNFLVEYDPQPWIIGNKDIKVKELAITFEDGVNLAYEILENLYTEYQVRLDFEDVKITGVFLTGLFIILLDNYTIDKLNKILIYKNMAKYIEDTKNLVIQHIIEYKANPERAKIIREIVSRIIEE